MLLSTVYLYWGFLSTLVSGISGRDGAADGDVDVAAAARLPAFALDGYGVGG